MGDKFADIRKIAAKESELKQRLKELEREREQSDKINFLVEERKKLRKLVKNQKIDEKTRIEYSRYIKILDELIYDELGDTDDEDVEFYKGKVDEKGDSKHTDSEEEKFYDGNETVDDPMEVENSLQYIKLKL